MNGNQMTVSPYVYSGSLVLLSVMLWLTACSSSPLPPNRSLPDEAHRVARIVQDRENELAAARAEVAAIRIAAAKKEAELSELRTLVTQLRQENGESHQALLEARQMAEARQTELAALKTERDQLLQAKTEQVRDRSELTVLQETVASITQELAELKQARTSPAPKAVARGPKSNNRKPSADQEEPVSSKRVESGERIMPAMHIVRDDTNGPPRTRITVQPGDTLWSLARKYRTTVMALRETNGIVGDAVVVGQELRLP